MLQLRFNHCDHVVNLNLLLLGQPLEQDLHHSVLLNLLLNWHSTYGRHLLTLTSDFGAKRVEMSVEAKLGRCEEPLSLFSQEVSFAFV